MSIAIQKKDGKIPGKISTGNERERTDIADRKYNV